MEAEKPDSEEEATSEKQVDEIIETVRRTQKEMDLIKKSNIIPLEHQEMNLDHEYWVTRFLYPFALDKAAINLNDYPIQNPMFKGSQFSKPSAGGDDNLLTTKRFNYPMSHIDHKKEYLEDILRPIIT